MTNWLQCPRPDRTDSTKRILKRREEGDWLKTRERCEEDDRDQIARLASREKEEQREDEREMRQKDTRERCERDRREEVEETKMPEI